MTPDPSGMPPLLVLPEHIDCADAEILISRHLDGELETADAAPLKSHLKRCATCRSQAQTWAETSCSLDDSLETLWRNGDDSAQRSIPKNPKKSRLASPQRSCYWLPLGMLASQFVALIGLAAYMLFFAPSAEAPRRSAALPEATPDQPAQSHSTPAESAATIHATTDVVILSEEPAALEVAADFPVPPEESPAQPSSTPLVTPAPEALVLAAPLPPPQPARPLRNVSMEYHINGQSGRITLLGDVLNGKAVIRLFDSSGQFQDVAQPDVDTLLSEPQRSAVRRFLAACADPSVRSRFEELHANPDR